MAEAVPKSMTCLLLWCAVSSSAAQSWGCGDSSYIEVIVESDLAIPTQVDTLALRVRDRKEQAIRLEKQYDLREAGGGFPIIVILAPTHGLPIALTMDAVSYKEHLPIAAGTVDMEWHDGETSEARIELELLPTTGLTAAAEPGGPRLVRLGCNDPAAPEP